MSDAKMNNQRGAAMFVVMITVGALLTAGLLTVHVGESETKSIDYVASSRRALFCAEAGVAAAREAIGGAFATWDTMLDTDTGNNPSWYPIRGYLDNASHGPSEPYDFEVTITDNEDESPATDDPRRDSDLRVFVVSRCLKYPETPRVVSELIEYEATGTVYRNQSGQGASNTGNAN
jgi:hypothetical protein